MNIDQFQEEYKGKAIDFDRYAGVQCADGAREYIEKSWKIKSAWFKPYAGNGQYGDDGVLDGFYSFRDGYISVVENREGADFDGQSYKIEIISNLNEVQRGDVVFTTGTNQYGHVGVFVGRDNSIVNTFQLFDQNGANPKSPAFWWSNYNNSTFVGALRKIITQPQTDMFKDKLTQTIPTIGFDPTTQNMLLQSVNNEDASYLLTFAGKAPRDDLDRANQEIARLKAELEKEPKTVEIANPVNVELQNKLDSLEKENKSLTEMLLVANKPSKDVHSIDTLQPAQPLPIWKRSFFDTARSGTYALAGVLASTGVWEMVQIYLATGDFSEESFSKLAISAGVVLAGYLQEQAKNNRKEAEKKI
jgi:hypothetical protein